MGQNFSAIQDDKQRIETKKAYDASLALMILNLIMVSLPIMSFYWIPYAGPWTIFTLSLVQIIFSVLVFKLFSKHIPNYGPGLPKSHLIISLVMAVLITISCIMQTVHWDDLQSYCSGYCYTYSGYNYYLPSLIIMGVVTPIMALVHMIIFSVNCSYIWNEMLAVATNSALQGLPLRTVNMGTYYPDYQLPQYGSYPAAHASSDQQHVQVSLTPGQYAAVQKLLEAQRQ